MEDRVGADLGAVDLLQAQPTAAAALGAVAEDQVGVDHQALADAVADSRRAVDVDERTALHPVGQGTVRIRAGDDQATTIGRQRRVDALVKEDPVVRDRAVESHPLMCHAGAVAAAQVAGDPVVVDPVVVRTGADRDAARARRRAGEQRVADRGVVDDHVVVDAVLHVQLERDRAERQNR